MRHIELFFPILFFGAATLGLYLLSGLTPYGSLCHLSIGLAASYVGVILGGGAISFLFFAAGSGAVLGVVAGLLLHRLRGNHLLLGSLVIHLVIVEVVRFAPEVTGGATGQSLDDLLDIGERLPLWLLIGLLLLGVGAIEALNGGRLGVQLALLRASEGLAESTGVWSAAWFGALWALSSAFVATGMALSVSYLKVVSPNVHTLGSEILVLSAVLVGYGGRWTRAASFILIVMALGELLRVPFAVSFDLAGYGRLGMVGVSAILAAQWSSRNP